LIEESFLIERRFVFEHEVDGPAQLMGVDTQGFAFVVLALQFGDEIFGLGAVPEHQDRSFLNGPFEMVVADFLVGMAGPFTVGFLDGFY
jgi:hypothetical protein